MSKALLGPATRDLQQLRLLDEVRSLRQRILDLEAQLEEAEREAALRRAEIDLTTS